VPESDASAFLEATVRNALFSNDGRIKPTGARFAELVAELRAAPAAAPGPTAIILDDTVPGYRARCAPGGSFFDAWVRAAEAEGRGPQVLLSSRARDEASVAGRGITRLIADETARA
jgi:hypothetical protein